MPNTNLPLEIIPGIYQIRLPLVDNPAGYINTYLIKGKGEWVMIDTGWNEPQAFEDFGRQLRELGLSFKNISLIIYTHIHPDHFGLAGIIKQKYGIELMAHREGKNLIDYRYYGRESYIKELGDWHLIHGGAGENADAVIKMSTDYTNHVAPVFPDIFLQGGETIDIDPFHLQVVWTPGHDHDHICLYEPARGIIFSGDHILPDTIPHIGIHAGTPLNPHDNYMKSLRTMRRLQATIILPGHEHVFNNLPQRIDELLAYHTRLKEDVLGKVSGESKTAYQISSGVKWIEGQVKWENLAPLTQAGLVTKCLSYLRALCIEGKAEEKVDKNRLRLYNAT